MDNIEVKIINRSDNPLPEYATRQSAGVDRRAWLPDGPVTLRPLGRALIGTGIHIQLPEGYEAQIRPRSGLALKHGISIVNTPGTIDADYRGEIGVILINLSDSDFTVNPGERICQMVIKRYSRASFTEAGSLDDSERGEGGFGHTGVS